MDKSNLLDGDREMLEAEPDREIFESHGFICEVVRHPVTFTLCGYVYIPKGHALYSVGGDDIDVGLKVHGGISYSSDRDGYWVLGFDCNHYGDYSPGMAASSQAVNNNDKYRRWSWVKDETEYLAEQISIVQHSTVGPDVLA